jgi:hypothetical protein
MADTDFQNSVQGLAAKLMDRAAARSPEHKERADGLARDDIFRAARGDGAIIDGKDVRHGAFPITLDDPYKLSGPRPEVWNPVDHAYRLIAGSFAGFERLMSESDRRNLREILTVRVAEIRAEREGKSPRRRFNPAAG